MQTPRALEARFTLITLFNDEANSTKCHVLQHQLQNKRENNVCIYYDSYLQCDKSSTFIEKDNASGLFLTTVNTHENLAILIIRNLERALKRKTAVNFRFTI
jgi:hypothetical protein